MKLKKKNGGMEEMNQENKEREEEKDKGRK